MNADNFGVQVLSAYDARNLLSSRTWQGTGVDAARAEFDYNALGQTTELRRFADATGTSQIGRTAFDYDAKGRLTDLTHRDALDAVLADYDYVRDLADQLTAETHHGETHDYTHDPTGQLTAADHAVADDEAYTYDANGNRTTAGHVTGPGNRLLSDGTHNFAYDAEGNLVTKTEIATGDYTEYTYDHRNRLVSAQDKSSGGIILAESTYTYDLFDRRIAKTVDPDGPGPQPSETTRFIYNGSHVWADFDATDTILARYLFGDSVDQLLARHRPAEGTAWHLTDHLGTVRDIVDAAGTLINHLDYDSFGNVLLETNPLFGDRYRFTGREFDPELGLYYYRARYYDPSIGRFTTEDPIAFAGGDANLYRYVGNSPLTFVDPWGLMGTVGYSTLMGLRHGVVFGAVLGMVCGGLDAWASGGNVGAGALEGALVAGIIGGSIGIGLGFLGGAASLSVVGNGGVAGTFAKLAAGISVFSQVGLTGYFTINGIKWIQQSQGIKQVVIRAGCVTAVAVLGVRGSMRSARQFFGPGSGVQPVRIDPAHRPGLPHTPFGGRWIPSGRNGGASWEGPGVPPKPPAPKPFAPTNKVSQSAAPKTGPATAHTVVHGGNRTAGAPRTGTPNSIHEQIRPNGSRSVTYYDNRGRAFAREDYGQLRPHGKLGRGPDGNSVPHEHRTHYSDRGPIGKQYRELDPNGKPVGPWYHD